MAISADSDEVAWWRGPLGHLWQASISDRVAGRPCPVCAALRVPTITHPHLAAQTQAPFNPDDYTVGSKAKVRWRGPTGHEWDATVAYRVKGSGCPVCARERRTPSR